MDGSSDWRESELVAAGASHSSATVWAVVVLDGSSGQVQGVVGPFRSAGYAQAYAAGWRLTDWLVVPALYLAHPTEVGPTGVAVL